MSVLVSDHACYVVQAFTEVDGRLIADVPLDASDPSEAAQLALDLLPCKAGVIAFEWSTRLERGQYLPPYVLARFGQVPEECQDWVTVAGPEERTPRKRTSPSAVAR